MTYKIHKNIMRGPIEQNKRTASYNDGIILHAVALSSAMFRSVTARITFAFFTNETIVQNYLNNVARCMIIITNKMVWLVSFLVFACLFLHAHTTHATHSSHTAHTAHRRLWFLFRQLGNNSFRSRQQ